ncbi:MAG TPA: formylglycine-generating enzyme family protein [Nitrospiria bacterium]|jgi:formylglycine-generating enzyme required for sulfatase activity
MSNLFKVIYLVLVFAIVGILYIGIYQSEPPAEQFSKNAGQEESKEFKSIAAQRKEIEEKTREAEKRVENAKIDPEFETMVLVSAGKFTMGSDKGSAMEQPAREVYLDAFYIDKYEATFTQFYSFIAATQYPRKPRLAGYLAVDPKGIPVLLNPYSPVVGVSWDDSISYCAWKDKRLPTEAEWEKAAKGMDQREWPWGNEENPKFANLVGEIDGFEYSSPVGSIREDRSPFGAYDMAGNAMEWVSSWFREDYYRLMPELNPKGPAEGDMRGIRGASWHDSILRAKTTIRFKTSPTYRDVTIGFRCAKSKN